MSEPTQIRCRENGPLVVKGPVQVVDYLGQAFALPTDKEFVALCRCGHSQRKPFCDGAHRTCGFQAAETAAALAPPASHPKSS